VEAMQDFLSGIGVDIEKAGMEKTPARVAEMFEYLFNGMNTDTAEIWGELFPSEADGIVVVKEIPFYSMCEHHLLPFFGRVSLAYLPKNGMVAGFSKFTKLVEVISHRPQLQERMTRQIAEAIADGLEAEGVLVIVEATQLCMCMRGDCAHDTRTMTSVGLGALKEGTALGQQAFSMIVDNRKELAR
jgi:GTP cyclohydrolase I